MLYVTKEIDREALPITNGDLFNLQIEAKQKDNPLKASVANVSSAYLKQVQLRYTYTSRRCMNKCLIRLKHLKQVIIKIRDLNDNAPTFDIDDYNMTIIEHLPNGFEIMTFRATDRDKVYY